MNDALATAPRRYALSFIAGGLLTREAVLLAPCTSSIATGNRFAIWE